MRNPRLLLASLAAIATLNGCQSLGDLYRARPRQTQVQRETARQAREDRRILKRLKRKSAHWGDGVNEILKRRREERSPTSTTDP